MHRDAGVEIALGADLAARRGIVTQSRLIEAGGHEVCKGHATLLRNALNEDVFELGVLCHGFPIAVSD